MSEHDFEKLFEDFAQKLAATPPKRSLLDSVDQLEQDLKGLDNLQIEEKMKLPYSTMPKLSSKRSSR